MQKQLKRDSAKKTTTKKKQGMKLIQDKTATQITSDEFSQCSTVLHSTPL